MGLAHAELLWLGPCPLTQKDLWPFTISGRREADPWVFYWLWIIQRWQIWPSLPGDIHGAVSTLCVVTSSSPWLGGSGAKSESEPFLSHPSTQHLKASNTKKKHLEYLWIKMLRISMKRNLQLSMTISQNLLIPLVYHDISPQVSKRNRESSPSPSDSCHQSRILGVIAEKCRSGSGITW